MKNRQIKCYDDLAKYGIKEINGKLYKQIEIKETKATCKHPKSGKTKEYLKYTWNYNKKAVNITKQTLVYLINNKDVIIPDNCDVAHLDDDPNNNDINNLVIVSRAENLKMRKSGKVNQYSYMNVSKSYFCERTALPYCFMLTFEKCSIGYINHILEQMKQYNTVVEIDDNNIETARLSIESSSNNRGYFKYRTYKFDKCVKTV